MKTCILKHKLDRLEMYTIILDDIIKDCDKCETKKDVVKNINIMMPIIEQLDGLKKEIITIIDFLQ